MPRTARTLRRIRHALPVLALLGAVAPPLPAAEILWQHDTGG